MKFLKKMAAGTLAAAAVVTSALSFGANALEYDDIKTWHLYANPYVSHPIEDVKLNYYSGGYRAVIKDKGFGGSYNYVIISQEDTQKAMLTEKNKVCQIFKAHIIKIDKDGDLYAPFRVQLYAEDIKPMTPYNDGEIKLSNMF